jgi:co-chaperonin GroES (HSP10)
MKPIGKYIVVVITNDEVKTGAGIVLSANDVSDFRYQRGVVVEPGTEVSNISKGDKVFFDKSHSFTMLIKDSPYTIIQERDVVLVE